jgi:hypothetical protein
MNHESTGDPSWSLIEQKGWHGSRGKRIKSLKSDTAPRQIKLFEKEYHKLLLFIACGSVEENFVNQSKHKIEFG